MSNVKRVLVEIGHIEYDMSDVDDQIKILKLRKQSPELFRQKPTYRRKILENNDLGKKWVEESAVCAEYREKGYY